MLPAQVDWARLTMTDDPKNRKLRVLTIGGGVTGILLAYRLQKDASNVEHVIYEKNEDIGGTWLENRFVQAFQQRQRSTDKTIGIPAARVIFHLMRIPINLR